jgi:hypothetical protein
LPDSASVFNDSPIEELMATEQTPPESDLRGPRSRRRDVNTLLWLCGWGGIATVALIILVITTQTESANERLRHLFSVKESPALAQISPRIAQLESETRFLATQMRALTIERDRLAGRIALLENSLEDLTGAIKKQAAATAAALAKPASAAPPTVTAPAAISAVTPVPATPSLAAAPLPKEAKQPASLPPARIAAVASEPEPIPQKQSEFGLDLGGGATMDNIRQRWTTVKANFGPLLSGMYPVAAHDHRAGATGYRLVVGPLPNSAAATGLCAHFTAARTTCRAVKFDGEQIAQQ